MKEKINTDIVFPEEVIISKIYFIRGEKVMLDRDLAKLFDVKAIRLREQVKRNVEKFPIHFMFQLTTEEVEIMVSQNAIPFETIPWRFFTIGLYGTWCAAIGKYFKERESHTS